MYTVRRGTTQIWVLKESMKKIVMAVGKAWVSLIDDTNER